MPPRKRKSHESLNYSQIHLPKMKSIFWKYFGFPADEHGEIITKAKVICTLCKAVLKNHYNTTNIRSHVQSNHKALFAQLIAKHGLTIPPRRTNPNQKRKRNVSTDDEGNYNAPKQRLPKRENKIEFSDASVFHEEDSFNVPLTYEDTEDEPSITTTQVSSIPMFDEAMIIDSQTAALPVVNANAVDKKKVLPLNITLDINPIQVNYNIEEALTKMIVSDLLNVSSIYNPGMKEFVTSFLSNQILPTLCKMEQGIENLYNNKFEEFRERIKVHSHVKSFSLSFDVWTNIEHIQFVSIHYNHISEEFEDRFCDNLYMTVELNSFTPFESIFKGFNLQNCSAAIINSNNETINTFLSSSEIPIVHCFAYIINLCLSSIFEIEEVDSTLNSVKNVMNRFSPEILLENLEVPVICEEFPITKLHLLRFFCESLSWPEDMQMISNKAKQIVEILSPLEITLDTLKEEDIPLSSLFLPFAEKIIEKHYAYTEFSDSLAHEIRSNVVNQFKRSVYLNNLLAVTAILDPRFHKFISLQSTNTCLNILQKKYKQMGKQRTSLQKNEPAKDEAQKASRKSNLKMLFDDCRDVSTENIKHENFIESDLRRYREEAFASLDESPIKWWNKWGNSFGSLRHLSEAYNCILGFVNLTVREPLRDQINFNRRRFTLTGKLINQILFLNKNP